MAKKEWTITSPSEWCGYNSGKTDLCNYHQQVLRLRVRAKCSFENCEIRKSTLDNEEKV